MYDFYRKAIGKETMAEKRARKEREARERFTAKMQAWQSQFRLDTSVTPHETAALTRSCF